MAEREPDVAMKIVSDRLNENPNEVESMFVAFKCHMAAERFGLAFNFIKRIIDLYPNDAGAWSNAGLALHGMMKIDEAEKFFRRALSLDPKNAPAMANMALVSVWNAEPEAAIQWADKAIATNGDGHPDNGVLESRGYACLMLGRWNEGWDGYEAMIGGSYRPIKPYRNEPYWKGEKTDILAVVGEQGIGDELSFSSILPDLIKDKERVKNVVLECDSRLEGLFRRSFDIPVFGTRFQKETTWPANYNITAHCLIGSIGRYYRLKDEDFTKKPYLVADPERRLQWRALLDSLGDKPKIGIAWTGGLKSTYAARRTLKLIEMLPILRQDATFVSLQYRDPTAEIADFEAKHGIKIHHWKRCTEVKDYDETAALVAELDLVIAVPTAVVDLCGGLGKDCWVLLPRKPHWRFSRHVWTDAKLYRQKADWAGVINKVANDLGEKCKQSFTC